MRRAGRPDAVVLLSCAVAALMLLPLREVTEHVPIVPFAAGLALFLAPGVLLSGWFLAGHVRAICSNLFGPMV
jgi:hypothetical protein